MTMTHRWQLHHLQKAMHTTRTHSSFLTCLEEGYDLMNEFCFCKTNVSIQVSKMANLTMRPIWCVACHRDGDHEDNCLLLWALVLVKINLDSCKIVTAFTTDALFTSHSVHPWTFWWMDIPMYFEPMGILQSNQCPGKWFWDITDTLYKALTGHDLICNPQVAPTPVAIEPAVHTPPPSQQQRVDPVPHTPQWQPESSHSTPWWNESLHITEICSNATNDTHHASDVTQPQMNSTQCIDRDQVLTESSFMNFQFDQNLIGDLLSFDGERDKFHTWKYWIQNIADIMGDDKALKNLRSWLGAKPSDFLHTRPLMYTLWEVLNCLTAEYDLVGDEMKAANKYCSIKQNTKSISDHHSEVYMLLWNMGKDINTHKSMIINTYIDLSQTKVSEKQFFASGMEATCHFNRWCSMHTRVKKPKIWLQAQQTVLQQHQWKSQ